MRRYVLKKDLPTFKAGDEFCIKENGKLVPADGQHTIAYSKQTLEQFPNILTDWFEEILEYKRWRAENGKSYWFIKNDGDVFPSIECNTNRDTCRYLIGNYFKNGKEATGHTEYLIALQTIKDDTKCFVPDWKDYNQLKYCGCYDYISECLYTRRDDRAHTQGVIYFGTEEDIEESFKKHRKEWLTVLGVEEKDETI